MRLRQARIRNTSRSICGRLLLLLTNKKNSFVIDGRLNYTFDFCHSLTFWNFSCMFFFFFKIDWDYCFFFLKKITPTNLQIVKNMLLICLEHWCVTELLTKLQIVWTVRVWCDKRFSDTCALVFLIENQRKMYSKSNLLAMRTTDWNGDLMCYRLAARMCHNQYTVDKFITCTLPIVQNNTEASNMSLRWCQAKTTVSSFQVLFEGSECVKSSRNQNRFPVHNFFGIFWSMGLW